MSKLYSSLRVIHPVERLRSGTHPNLISAMGDRTIEFRDKPYPHFVVLPMNVEVPVINVTSAIPMGAPAASSQRRTTGRKPKADE